MNTIDYRFDKANKERKKDKPKSDKMVLTEQQFKKIISTAFEAGETWGICYYGWFDPSKEDTSKHIEYAIEKCRNILKERR